MKRLAVFLAVPGLLLAAFTLATVVPASAAPDDALDDAVVELLAAGRISGSTGSYRRDNPNEYLRVTAYLAGGERPAEPLTRMGRGLVLVEDVRRAHDDPEPPPTTTEPEPPPPTEPEPPPTEPPGETLIVEGTNWRCTGPVDYDLVRVTNPGNTRDALVLGPGCTGRIGRIELSGPMADGIKVQNTGTVARDIVIEGGFVFCGQAAPGVHQDGMQAMGGFNITFRNLVIDCLGGGGGNWFPARGGSGASTPTGIVCDGCAFGPNHPNNVQIQTSIDSGIRDSLVCRPLSGRNPIVIGATAVRPVNVGSVIAPTGDPRCTREGLLAYVGG